MTNQLVNFIRNLSITVYQVVGLSFICAFLLSSLCLLIGKDGWKSFLKKWWDTLRKDKLFRYRFFFAFSTFGVLGITLLTRRIWYRPWENVIGNFAIIGSNGRLDEDSLNNILLFIPFSVFMCSSSIGRINRYVYKKGKISYGRVVLCTCLVSFVFSTAIECSQSVFWLGTFQLADIFFNTVGGLIGGMSYCLWKILKKGK